MEPFIGPRADRSPRKLRVPPWNVSGRVAKCCSGVSAGLRHIPEAGPSPVRLQNSQNNIMEVTGTVADSFARMTASAPFALRGNGVAFSNTNGNGIPIALENQLVGPGSLAATGACRRRDFPPQIAVCATRDNKARQGTRRFWAACGPRRILRKDAYAKFAIPLEHNRAVRRV